MFTIEVQKWPDLLPLIMISYISRQGTKDEQHNPNVHKYQVFRMEKKFTVIVTKDIGGEWLLFNANSAIFQLYHGENKLIFNEMMMRSALY